MTKFQKKTESRSPSWHISFLLMFFITAIFLIFNERYAFGWGKTTAVMNMVFSWFLYFHCDQDFKSKTHKIWQVSTIIISGAVLLYIFLRFLNVYDLPRQQFVQNFCTHFSTVCTVSVQIFFGAKIFRFITLSFPFLLSFFLLFLGLSILSNDHKDVQKQFSVFEDFSLLQVMLALAAVILCFTQLLFVAERVLDLSIRSWQARNLSFAERFVPFEFGIEHQGWIWLYAEFLKKHVPEKAVMDVPPQSDVWPQEGNIYYFRWFVYPREMVQSSDPQAPLSPDAEYVLISRGGWQGGARGWPKRAISPECIDQVFLMRQDTQEETQTDPNMLTSKLSPTVWGVIKLKENRSPLCL